MVELCIAIMRNGNRCTAYSNDSGNVCGRHGGPSIAEIRRRRVLPTRDFDITRLGPLPRHRIYNVFQLDDESQILYFSSINAGSMSKKVDCFVDKCSDVNMGDCAVCLEKDIDCNVKLGCCKQAFCTGCAKSWFNTKTTCPFCRAYVDV